MLYKLSFTTSRRYETNQPGITFPSYFSPVPRQSNLMPK